jgi:hypothetical protein
MPALRHGKVVVKGSGVRWPRMADGNDKGLERPVSKEGITIRVIWVRGSGEGQEKASPDGLGDRGMQTKARGAQPTAPEEVRCHPWVDVLQEPQS